MSGVGTGIAIAAGVGLAGAGVGAAASMSAADTQASAAKSAAQLQYEESQNALAFQQQEFQTQQANEAPFLKAGQGAVNSLSQYAPFTPPSGPFVPPTLAQAEQDPGFQFMLKEGTTALDQSAAATGNLYSGTQGRALTEFGQGLADTKYNEVYNRALQTYGTNYNTALNTYEANLNRLQSLAGEGLTSAGQINTAGTAAAGNVAGIDISTGRNIAQEMNNAAAAEASGYVGASNAVTGAANSLGQYALLNQFLNPTTYPSTANFAPTGYNPPDAAYPNPPDVTGLMP